MTAWREAEEAEVLFRGTDPYQVLVMALNELEMEDPGLVEWKMVPSYDDGNLSEESSPRNNTGPML